MAAPISAWEPRAAPVARICAARNGSVSGSVSRVRLALRLPLTIQTPANGPNKNSPKMVI